MTGINTQTTGLKTFAEFYGTGYQPTGTSVLAPASFNNTTAKAPAPNLVQNGTNNLEKTPKSDTITIAGKTIKKKTAIKAGLGALATAAVIGIGILAFRGRFKTPPTPVPNRTPNPDIIPPADVSRVAPDVVPDAVPVKIDFMPPEMEEASKEAFDLCATANGVLEKAEQLKDAVSKKIDEVTKLFEAGGKDAEGKVVAHIRDDADNAAQRIMEELSDDGTLLRKSTFVGSCPVKIEEFIEGTKKKNITVFDIIEIDKKEFPDAPTERFSYPISYIEGLETTDDGTQLIIAKELDFSGSYYDYIENKKVFPDESQTIQTKLSGIGAKPSYIQDYTISADNSTFTSAIELHFRPKENQPVHYFKDNIFRPNDKSSHSKYLYLEDGKPVKYEDADKEFIYSKDFTKLFATIGKQDPAGPKHMHYEDGNWVENK